MVLRKEFEGGYIIFENFEKLTIEAMKFINSIPKNNLISVSEYRDHVNFLHIVIYYSDEKNEK